MIYLNKVSCDIKNHIAFVKINNPPVNSLSEDVMVAINDCFDDLYKNDDIRAVIITGKGKSFAAGADITEFISWTPERADKLTKKGQDIFNKIENYPRPVIATINGYALGGGLELALACDIRIASKSAKLGLPEATLGIVPGYGGTARLPRVVNEGQAKKMIFTGEIIGAVEARDIGLIQEVISEELLIVRSMELATKIGENAPIAISNAKKIINIGRSLSIEEKLKYEAEAAAVCFISQDKVEGVDAFINKRKAKFINR